MEDGGEGWRDTLEPVATPAVRLRPTTPFRPSCSCPSPRWNVDGGEGKTAKAGQRVFVQVCAAAVHSSPPAPSLLACLLLWNSVANWQKHRHSIGIGIPVRALAWGTRRALRCHAMPCNAMRYIQRSGSSLLCFPSSIPPACSARSVHRMPAAPVLTTTMFVPHLMSSIRDAATLKHRSVVCAR